MKYKLKYMNAYLSDYYLNYSFNFLALRQFWPYLQNMQTSYDLSKSRW